MLQNKSVKDIWKLKNGFTHRWVEPDFLSDLLHVFRLSILLKCYKHKTKRHEFGIVDLLFIVFSILATIQCKSVFKQIAATTLIFMQYILLTFLLFLLKRMLTTLLRV